MNFNNINVKTPKDPSFNLLLKYEPKKGNEKYGEQYVVGDFLNGCFILKHCAYIDEEQFELICWG